MLTDEKTMIFDTDFLYDFQTMVILCMFICQGINKPSL